MYLVDVDVDVDVENDVNKWESHIIMDSCKEGR
jgi:hypothetical protein